MKEKTIQSVNFSHEASMSQLYRGAVTRLVDVQTEYERTTMVTREFMVDGNPHTGTFWGDDQGDGIAFVDVATELAILISRLNTDYPGSNFREHDPSVEIGRRYGSNQKFVRFDVPIADQTVYRYENETFPELSNHAVIVEEYSANVATGNFYVDIRRKFMPLSLVKENGVVNIAGKNVGYYFNHTYGGQNWCTSSETINALLGASSAPSGYPRIDINALWFLDDTYFHTGRLYLYSNVGISSTHHKLLILERNDGVA